MTTYQVPCRNELSSEYPLTEDQIRQFRETGHVLLKGVCTKEEIVQFGRMLKLVTTDRFSGIKKMADRPEDDFSRVFLQTFNIREADQRAASFIQAPRFGKIAADLMGVHGVRIYYDKVMFKEPKSWTTPWHQDAPHWPLYSDNVLTMWIPLVDVAINMGPPRFASGTHKSKALGPSGIRRSSESFYDSYIQENRIPIVEEEICAGDATLHNHWLIHGARANTSSSVRAAFGITYYEDGIQIDDSACSQENRPVIDENLGRRRPGDSADHSRNQVVFTRK